MGNAINVSQYLAIVVKALATPDSEFYNVLLTAEEKYALETGIFRYSGQTAISDYTREELVELAIARSNVIKSEQRRIFGEDGEKAASNLLD